jgi:hypothetical protein
MATQDIVDQDRFALSFDPRLMGTMSLAEQAEILQQKFTPHVFDN